jgi:hypothetical protein
LQTAGHKRNRSQYRRSAPADVADRNKNSNICCEHRRKVASAKQLEEDACLHCCDYGALEVMRTRKTAVQKLCHSTEQEAAERHSYQAKISVGFAKRRKGET